MTNSIITQKLVSVTNGDLTTTSFAIAAGTENDHASVIKLIRTYQADLEGFGLLDFKSESTAGRPTEYALLNERQATLLISYMRNSDVVREFKIRLVREFYEMAEATRRRMSPAEILIHQGQLMLTLEHEQARQAEAQRRLEQKQEQTERRLDQIETAQDHFTIIGWWRYAKQSGSLPLADAARMGKQATSFCLENEVAVGEVPDPRFGTVKTYPKWVLDGLFTN